ncbi:Fic family protein [Candidatus Shapirobacteria bacterium]|nr:MAG: Fic family protein [Candidatus Shapirobacteria bacterium]
MKLGKYIKQPQGYKAFIPDPFPPKRGFDLSSRLIQKASMATLKLGKLDGITQLLPDKDFFLFMYIRKDATSSSQIEGTQATMIDAIEAESKTTDQLPDDVNDILHYIDALNYGIKRLEKIPLSLRLIKEIHRELMTGGRTTQFADPGYFRKSQNWISGSSPTNARFVPPPPSAMLDSLSNLEKFLHQKDKLLPVIKAGLIHAQFETIHPFLDSNGRTGRMLITIYLHMSGLLELPVLFLSWYFKNNQKFYYESLRKYANGQIDNWLDFFLDGITTTADEAVETVKRITLLRERDMRKIQSLGKQSATSSIKVLRELFKMPIVNVNTIRQWTGYSTRQGAQKVIDRFIKLEILELKDKNKTYGRSFIYKEYLDIFK